MPPPVEAVWDYSLSAAFVAIGGFFLYREQRLFASSAGYEGQPPTERSYRRKRFWRRTIASTLLVVLGLAVFSVATFVDEHRLPRVFAWFWITILTLVLVLLGFAGVDLFAIRRYARRERRRIIMEREAMLARQLAQLRRERGRAAPPDGWSPELN